MGGCVGLGEHRFKIPQRRCHCSMQVHLSVQQPLVLGHLWLSSSGPVVICQEVTDFQQASPSCSHPSCPPLISPSSSSLLSQSLVQKSSMAFHYPPRTNHKASPGLGNTTQPDHRRLPRPASPCFAEVSGGSKHIMLLVLYKLGPVIALTGALFPCSSHNILCNLQLPCPLAVTPPPCLQHSVCFSTQVLGVCPDDPSASQAGGEAECCTK